MIDSIIINIGGNLSTDDVKKRIQNAGLKVLSQQPRKNLDAIATTFIVTGANVLIAVLNTIFYYLQAKKSGKIVVQGIDGWRVEIPADTPQDDFLKIIEIASSRTIHQITISKS